MTRIDLTVHEDRLKNSIQRARERNIIIPTFAQMRDPDRMPEKIDSNAVEIAFGAVDEAAWVWLNGEYLGCHDLGLEGWNQPFEVDCRKEVRWGAENVLAVRVLDSGAAGGIWKPVRIDVLK